MARRIHPTAIVSPRAEIGDDVVIGPYVVIEAGVRMGTRNVIHPFAVIGGDPQIRKTSGATNKRGDLLIGDDNVIREHVHELIVPEPGGQQTRQHGGGQHHHPPRPRVGGGNAGRRHDVQAAWCDSRDGPRVGHRCILV
jgi:acyl-[acyl carrier protein]--UDP-N-acetylglucosamine O-acyltransferase